MISATDSLPIKTEAFLRGMDVLYFGFNDIEFYVEDEDQENLYLAIFKRLFPGVKLEKIFPLGGKKNVRDEARLHVGNKKKVFVVDKDFDDLLGRKLSLPNLFYLDRYSIEN